MRVHGTKLRSVRKKRRFSVLAFFLLGILFLSLSTLISFFYVTSSSSLFFPSNIADCSDGTIASLLVHSKVSPFKSFSQSVYHSEKPPSYQYSLKNPPPNAPYTTLHTVTTRFMVGQSSIASNLFHLAKARYHLFETFCWPTVKHQTSQNFFWIVLVDPGLHEPIITGMKNLLSRKHFPEGNAFLILTNNTNWASDGIGVENSTSYGVGLQPIAEQYRDGKLEIIAGNTDHLLRALDTMKGKESASSTWMSTTSKAAPIMVVETLLDADDGLNNQAVEWIQNTAIQKTQEHIEQQQQQKQTMGRSRIPLSLNSSWWFLCGTDHIEWHNREIYKLSKTEYAEAGISSGLAGLRQSPLFCTSAGFTRVGVTEATVGSTDKNTTASAFSHMTFPKDAYSNHALAFYFPECTAPSSSSAVGISNGNYSACWHREFPGEAYILKSRTITSDSMDHMNPRRSDDYRDVAWLNKTDYPLIINETEKFWRILGQEFSIDRSMAWETSVYLFQNRQTILRENKNSRCTPGFPCYKEAKKNHIRMEKYWRTQAKEERLKAKQANDAKKQKVGVPKLSSNGTIIGVVQHSSKNETTRKDLLAKWRKKKKPQTEESPKKTKTG